MEGQPTYTWVKVPASSTQVADDSLYETGSLYEIDEAPPPNPHGRGAVDESKVNGSILTPKSILTVGCWNVRTLYTTGATAVLIHELEKCRWHIIGNTLARSRRQKFQRMPNTQYWHG